MVYEWDERRARRAYLTRMGLITLGALVTVAIPTWIAFAMKVV